MSLTERFRGLLGSWSGVEEVFPSPRGPNVFARAAQTLKLDLGGAAVVQDYRQVRADGRELLAHGVFLDDETRPNGLLWWLFDSAAEAPEPAPGAWTNDALVLVRASSRARTTHRFMLDAGRLSYAIDILPGPDAEPVPYLRGRYERVSGH